MRRRSRLVRVAKWGGVVLLVMLGSLWLVSCQVHVTWYDDTGTWQLWMVYGAVGISEHSPPPRPLRRGWRIEPHFYFETWWIPIVALHNSPPPSRTELYLLPFWPPMLFFIISTPILWYLDGPSPRGHCKCGYNLTGNVSGTCPECGTPFSRKGEAR